MFESLKKLDNFGILPSRSPFYQLVISPKSSHQELRDRAKSLWSSVAIISALVATISCANLSGSFTNNFDDEDFYRVYVFLNWLCTCFSLLSAVIICVAWANLETVPLENTKVFFSYFYWMAGLPGVLFTIGAGSLMLAYLVQFYKTIDLGTFIGTIVIGVIVFVFAIAYQSFSHELCVNMYKNDISSINGSVHPELHSTAPVFDDMSPKSIDIQPEKMHHLNLMH